MKKKALLKGSAGIARTLIFLLTFVVSVMWASGEPVWAQSSPSTKLPELVIFSGKGPGSTGYIIGTSIAKLVSKHTPMKTTYSVVGNLITSVKELEKGGIDFHGSGIPIVHDRYWGLRNYAKAGPAKQMRLITEGYLNQQGWQCRPDKGIKTIKDLEGKRLMALTPGWPHTEYFALGSLEFYGANKDKCTLLPVPSHKEIAAAMLENRVDAYFTSTGGGTGLEIQATLGGLTVLDISKECIEYIRKVYPVVYWADIDQATRKSWPFLPKREIGVLTHPVPQYTWATRPEEMIYQVVKAVYDYENELHALHPKTGTITLKKACSMDAFTVPFHPGAIKYYREKGVWTPEHDKRQKELLSMEKWK
jgi:TRAP transporter TAXI family solute receptor